MPLIVDKKKKRKEIIEAAITVFSKTGYRRAKMEQIALEAGIGKGTLYEYFGSKRDLFMQMSEYLYEQYMLNQKKTLDSVSDPEQRIRTLIHSTLEQAAMWTDLTRLFIDVWSEIEREGEEDKLRQLIANVYKSTANVLAGYIREGQESRLFKDLDDKLTALVILAALDGLVFQLLISKDMFELKAMIDTLSDLLIFGLKK